MLGSYLKATAAFVAPAAFAFALLGAISAQAQNTGQDDGRGNGGGGQPNCSLLIESGPDQWILDFDPLTESAARREFDLSVVNRGSGPCTGVAGVELRGESFGLSQLGAGTSLAYTLVDERSGRDVTPRAGESSRQQIGKPFNLGPGDRQLLRFSFVVNSGVHLGAGLYTQTAFVTIDHPNGELLTDKPVTLGVRVASSAMMGLKGEFERSGGVATINLGVLTEGSRMLNTTLYVLSTTGYGVSVSSANSGRLRQGVTDWYVPYTLAVGSTQVNLSSPARLEVTSRQTRADDYPLAITVGSVAGRRAGEYSDVVTFTVSAL